MPEDHPSGAKQAAEKLIKLTDLPEKHHPGAEAPIHFAYPIGTTEVVP
jgi:hypothetical protein